MKKILFVASEGVPFIKTGGLADVVGSLPKELDKEYYDVRVIMPKYSCMKQEMKDKMEYVTHFYMDFHWKSEYVGVLKAEVEGITFYFIDNEGFFTSDKPYTDDPLFAFIQYIVPMQVSARRISLDQGTDCERSADPDFHREMESYIY